MIKNNVILILGAGASKPYGFPTGKELKNEICEFFVLRWKNCLLNKSYEGVDNLRIDKQERLAKEFVQAFKKFKHDSIDLFLALNPDYIEIGKTAIYLTILEHENQNKNILAFDDWYTTLFGLMLEGIKTPEEYQKLTDNHIAIISFNYDRSLESFLYEAFINSTKSIKNEEKIKILRKLKIYHIYGKLGELPWENDEGKGIEYGHNIWTHIIDRNKKNIKTIYERGKEDTLDPKIMEEIKQARKIFFLGFGFAQENVDMLKLPIVLRDNYSIYTSDFENREKKLDNKMRTVGAFKLGTTFINEGDCKRPIEDCLS